MQVFVNKSGESTERPASPSVSQKSSNSCSPPALCSTPKESTSVQLSNTPTNITVTEDIHDTDLTMQTFLKTKIVSVKLAIQPAT